MIHFFQNTLRDISVSGMKNSVYDFYYGIPMQYIFAKAKYDALIHKARGSSAVDLNPGKMLEPLEKGDR
jgi:hypothetical protein